MSLFGVTSTVLGHGLFAEEQVVRIADAGFASLELVAQPGHLDLHDAGQLDRLNQAAQDRGLAIGSVSVAVEDGPAAIQSARDRGWPVVVIRSGACRLYAAAARASIVSDDLVRKLAERAHAAGIRIAIQSPSNAWRPEALVDLLSSLDDPISVCLDIGHAELAGGPAEWAETLSGFVVTTRLHDNNGREDAHRAPGDGAIDWPAALMACWKTGVNGPWILDNVEDPVRPGALRAAIGARARLQAILDDLAQPITFTE